jgi:hypothetical protein
MSHLIHDKQPAENCQVRIVVEDTCVLWAFDRPTDHIALPWQNAISLGWLTLQAAEKVPKPPTIVDVAKIKGEQSQVKFNHKDGLVYAFFKHGSQLRFRPDTAVLVVTALHKNAQDEMLLEQHRTALLYNKRGHLKEIVDLKNNTRQILPGR